MEVYIEDILFKSLEAEDHISHLQPAFSTLRKYNIKLNSVKCSFGVSSGKFLGYIIHLQTLRQISCLLWNPQNPKDFQWMDECESVPHELTAYLTTPPLLSKPLLGKVMLLYLAVSEHAVSAVLIREEGSKQIPIYYVLADFVAQFSSTLLPTLGQEVRLQSEAKEEGEWVMHVDGSSNVRGAGVGIVLTSPTGNTASRAVRCNFKVTNNESEYEALIAGLTLAHQMGEENIQVFSDSQLIINQVQSEYQSKNDSMIQYLAVAQQLIKKFKSCKLTQIPREQN
ncbi:PREDICTED: uncharacterized protein LOC106338360 [Brassica oleracea var. oleracea]|uniref:uncharacterized protein LOC106338360 n=1 Tax=Brassica oleracea var. oleracea TaxID=109376 RepID=UPI0006A74C6A|nr:PREDICTED: uncharacterized protein LOC106338360 [Brassica oleracea var. oleracea]